MKREANYIDPYYSSNAIIWLFWAILSHEHQYGYELGVSQLNVAGVSYGENKVSSKFQTEVAGSFISNVFDMGNQVPAIYQVWAVIDHLPFGIIGGSPHWVCAISSWEEIPE